jgi:hypothetical protein
MDCPFRVVPEGLIVQYVTENTNQKILEFAETDPSILQPSSSLIFKMLVQLPSVFSGGSVLVSRDELVEVKHVDFGQISNPLLCEFQCHYAACFPSCFVVLDSLHTGVRMMVEYSVILDSDSVYGSDIAASIAKVLLGWDLPGREETMLICFPRDVSDAEIQEAVLLFASANACLPDEKKMACALTDLDTVITQESTREAPPMADKPDDNDAQLPMNDNSTADTPDHPQGPSSTIVGASSSSSTSLAPRVSPLHGDKDSSHLKSTMSDSDEWIETGRRHTVSNWTSVVDGK